MYRSKVFCTGFFVAIAIGMVAVLLVTDAEGQQTRGERRRLRANIVLLKATPRLKVNGYLITKGNGKSYLKIVNAFDPVAKKPVEGKAELKYRCKPADSFFDIFVDLSNGTSLQPEPLLCTPDPNGTVADANVNVYDDGTE